MLVLAASCSTTRKITHLRDRELSATISLGEDVRIAEDVQVRKADASPHRDTVTVNVDGHDMLIMKAVRDDESGEMVATEQLRAAMVTARFRNVAERHGKVDLKFELRVPVDMYDSKWQLRLTPDMFVLSDSVRLDKVIVTGADYRRAQLRGYQQYERFLSRIVEDPYHFIDLNQLEFFLQRNIPQVYSFKSDTTFVSDEEFESCFGVTERQAVEHYTDKIGVWLNERRKSMRTMMYARYVKAPIETDHIRLDTVMRSLDGDFIYQYTQTLAVRPQLRKADIVLSGGIFEQDKQLYTIPRSEPLTYYISSLSSFVDGRERYLTEVVERSMTANAAWNIDFELGKADIRDDLGDNAAQIGNIRNNLRRLVTDDSFVLDSITIAAFASPEGPERLNAALSARRAENACRYFSRFARTLSDSLRLEEGMSVVVGEDSEESSMTFLETVPEIKFKTSASGENWTLLDHLVRNDSLLTPSAKSSYAALESVPELDRRESLLKMEPCYPYLKERLFPLLRTVQFNFFLHRKGMAKDTVHTTVLDSVYMRGVQAVRDRDYETAVALLMPYDDFNTAIAYASLDRNVSAKSILERLEKTAQVNYMLAIIYSRLGDDDRAVESYLRACSQEPSFVHRGNLDPEIAELIRTYGLNKETET